MFDLKAPQNGELYFLRNSILILFNFFCEIHGKKTDYKRDRIWFELETEQKMKLKKTLKSLNCKMRKLFYFSFQCCIRFVCFFFCAGTLEWHFHEKEEDGKYFSIFNENSCAKISGEFYMYLVFNLEELFYARARTSSPNKNRRIKDVILKEITYQSMARSQEAEN